MSDFWYRDAPTLPPYEDGFGKLWTLDGQCLNPDPPDPAFAWLDEWPEDLQGVAVEAAVNMQLTDEYWRRMSEAAPCPLCGGPGFAGHDDAACKAKGEAWRPTGLLAMLEDDGMGGLNA